MATEDQKRWDEKHASGDCTEGPSPFLEEIFRSDSWTLAPGRALDIATGKGRNALFLAARGFSVDAIDVSAVALEEARKRAEAKNLTINFMQADLDRANFPESAYDWIINFNFLDRALIPRIKAALKPGGRIVFETFLVDQKAVGHPRNPAYLLARNELLDAFREFRILYYREGKVLEGAAAAYRVGLFAEKNAR